MSSECQDPIDGNSSSSIIADNGGKRLARSNKSLRSTIVVNASGSVRQWRLIPCLTPCDAQQPQAPPACPANELLGCWPQCSGDGTCHAQIGAILCPGPKPVADLVDAFWDWETSLPAPSGTLLDISPRQLQITLWCHGFHGLYCNVPPTMGRTKPSSPDENSTVPNRDSRSLVGADAFAMGSHCVATKSRFQRIHDVHTRDGGDANVVIIHLCCPCNGDPNCLVRRTDPSTVRTLSWTRVGGFTHPNTGDNPHRARIISPMFATANSSRKLFLEDPRDPSHFWELPCHNGRLKDLSAPESTLASLRRIVERNFPDDTPTWFGSVRRRASFFHAR